MINRNVKRVFISNVCSKCRHAKSDVPRTSAESGTGMRRKQCLTALAMKVRKVVFPVKKEVRETGVADTAR